MSPAGMTVIAVASGKGGTGKTTVAAHLALACARTRATILVDLDVEAPDSYGYFSNASANGPAEPVSVLVPFLDEGKCSGCGLCARSCRFGAILAIGGVITIDAKVCKGCGRCVAVCPTHALIERETRVGETTSRDSGGLGLLEGRMDVGDIRSTVVIEATKRRAEASSAEVQIRDCPPGVSCPATHAVEGADYVILVAEPTEFSMHDLGAALKLARERGIPTGIVINKDGFGGANIDDFCAGHNATIIGRIAFKRERAASGAAAALWRDDPGVMDEMDGVLARAMAGARTRGRA